VPKKTMTPKQPARLIRFVDYGALPAGMAAQYDVTNNLVRIDKPLYDSLNVYEQSVLMFTKEDVHYAWHPNNNVPTQL
jgi:hypothetical protein